MKLPIIIENYLFLHKLTVQKVTIEKEMVYLKTNDQQGHLYRYLERDPSVFMQLRKDNLWYDIKLKQTGKQLDLFTTNLPELK